MKRIFSAILISCFLTVLLVSCTKDDGETTIPDTDVSSVSDDSESQSAFDDMSRMGEDVLTKNNVRGRITEDIACATVTIDTSKAVKIITMVFDGTCVAYDGKVRSGSIEIKISGRKFNEAGAITVIKPIDYTVNGNRIEGMQVMKCISPGTHNLYVTEITSNDSVGTSFAKITFADGKITQWRSARQRVCAENCTDLFMANNLLKIQAIPGTGTQTASGVSKKNISYTVNIESPIYIDFKCYANGTSRYPTKGITSITPSGFEKRTIDYGDGTCDKAVTVTIAGNSYNLNLD